MLDITQIIKTTNAIIIRSSDKHLTSVTIGNNAKPSYNHNRLKTPEVCKLNLDCCNKFYKQINSGDEAEYMCPLGFTISKKHFDISTNQRKISIYSIVNYTHNKDSISYLNSLPKNIKHKKQQVISELETLKIDEVANREHHFYMENLLETLLVGRIGVALQGISHQFFTPLQGALSDIQNLKETIKYNESLNRLETNIDALNKLATEVQLILASSEEFNHNMLRRITVHSVVDKIFESLTSTAKQKHITLRQGFNTVSKTVNAIPGQFYIVLSNIIHNAIKYSFTGYLNHPLEVSVEYFDAGDGRSLAISVRNHGCKITKEEIRDGLLFDLGYRGVYSRDRQRNGTGTGLYIANEITKAHGGSINVTSVSTNDDLDQPPGRSINTFIINWPIYIDA